MEEILKFSFLGEENKELGYIEYIENESSITLLKTYVLKEGRGKGIAKILNTNFLNFCKDKNKKIIIKCSYSADFFNKNAQQFPSLNVLVDIGENYECSL